MTIIFTVLLIIINIIFLLSIMIYSYLAFRGNSLTLYSTIDSRLSSFKQNLFLGSAALGFVICIFLGAKEMLFWIPDDWGHMTEDGFETTKSSIAGLFTAVTSSLLVFIDSSVHREFSLVSAVEKCKGLEKIVKSSRNGYDLLSLREEFIYKIEGLVNKRKERGGAADSQVNRLMPEDTRIYNYQELIAIIDDLLKKLDHRSHQETDIEIRL